MPYLADYKVLSTNLNEIHNLGGALQYRFEIGGTGVLLTSQDQRPYVTYNITVPIKGGQQTVSVSLNGNVVDTREYTTNPGGSTRTTPIPGRHFVDGSNLLQFSVTDAAPAATIDVSISDVIMHFQREA